MRGRRLPGLAFVLGMASAYPGPLSAQAPAAEPVLIELTIGRIASRTVQAYRSADEALIPLGAFFDLAEIRANRRPDGGLDALLQPGNVPFVVEPATHQVRIGKQKLDLGADKLMADGSDTYLATATLATALGIEWDVSWPDLQVAVIEPGSLPIARRLRREAMLKAQLDHASETQYTGLELGLERPRVDGLTVDYSVLAPTTGLSGSAYSTTMGLDVMGGSLALGLESQGPGQGPRSEASWTGVWRDSRYLTQLSLGDAFASGPRGRTLRGFSLTNAAYVQAPTVGDVPFAGTLGAGWTVEAYRGGRLIGFDSVNALGQFRFDVPIQYGENPVDFVAYGPFGEVREFNQTYRVASDGLPANHFEYAVSGGECRTTLCSATGNLDLRYGLTTRWTLRGGVDQFWRDSLGNLSHPYVGVTGTISNAFQVDGEAVANAVLRGAVRYEPSVNLQLQAEVNRFAQGVVAPILTPAGRQSQWTLTGFLRPLSELGATYLEASLDHINAGATDLTSGRLGGSLQFSGIRLLPAVRFQRQIGAGPTESQTFYGVNSFVLPQPSLGKVLGSLSARTSFEVEQGVGPSSASGYLGATLMRGLRGEAGVSWFRGSKGPALSLLVAAELPTVRSYTTVTAGGGNQALGSQYVTGSAIYDRARGGVDFSGSSALSRGGVSGRVFLDANGNGRLDPGEELLPNVRVIVGPTFSFSDTNGTFKVWDLLPYEPTSVTVDSTTLTSPLWVPAFARVQVEPSPNRYRIVDIPILPGGVVEGRVTSPDGRSLAGISVVLKHKASGEQRVLTTFSDGSFYAIGVRPGDWELTVDRKCLEVLKASAEPLKFTLTPSVEGTTVSGLEVVLH